MVGVAIEAIIAVGLTISWCSAWTKSAERAAVLLKDVVTEAAARRCGEFLAAEANIFEIVEYMRNQGRIFSHPARELASEFLGDAPDCAEDFMQGIRITLRRERSPDTCEEFPNWVTQYERVG